MLDNYVMKIMRKLCGRRRAKSCGVRVWANCTLKVRAQYTGYTVYTVRKLRCNRNLYTVSVINPSHDFSYTATASLLEREWRVEYPPASQLDSQLCRIFISQEELSTSLQSIKSHRLERNCHVDPCVHIQHWPANSQRTRSCWQM